MAISVTRLGVYAAALAVLAAGVGLVITRLPAETVDKDNLTVAGASPGGLWSALGVGLDKAVNKSHPEATITYQTSSGGLANAKLVADGKVPLGIISDIELRSAWDGTGVFKGRPQKNLRVLFRLFDAESRFQSIHLLLNRDFAKKNGVRTFADIVAKKLDLRVAVNRPGNMDGDMGIAILEALGASIDDIKSWGGQVIRAATREQTNLMTDRRLDLINFGLSYDHASVRELANAVRLLMLDIPEPAAASVVARMGGKTCGFKKGEYEFLDQDVTTVCTGAVLIAREDLDEETAHALTKAMLDNLDAFKSAHPQLEEVTTFASVAEGSSAPRHPGAERALREAGLID
jgi:TRAP transporter TAXI family solute receptor